MTESTILTAGGYDRIDGRNAYQSSVKRLTLGPPVSPCNRGAAVAAQVWAEEDGAPSLRAELPLHQVLDLAIFVSRGLLHFREAYRLPLLYDPDHPVIDRIGLQGDAMEISVCPENPTLSEDIQAFSLALSGLDEQTGERLRVLAKLVQELA